MKKCIGDEIGILIGSKQAFEAFLNRLDDCELKELTRLIKHVFPATKKNAYSTGILLESKGKIDGLEWRFLVHRSRGSSKETEEQGY